MSDALTDFLEGLAARGQEPLLATTTGRFCFELSDGDGEARRMVCIDHGRIDLVSGDVGADSTVRASRETFERVATGEMNAMAAVLRGEIELEGNWELLVRFQRLFPSPGTSAAKQAGAKTTSAA